MTYDKDLGRIDEAIRTLKTIASDLRVDREKDRDKFINIFTEMNQNLVRINATVETVVGEVNNHVASDDRIHGDSDIRIRNLENSKYKAIGYAGGAGAVAGGLITAAKLFFK